MKATVAGPSMPEGEQPCQLISVEELPPMKNSQYENAGPRWAWRFRGSITDPATGQMPEGTIFTGTRFGGPRAGLTKLWKMMFPHLTDAQRAETDTDNVIGQWFDIMWTIEFDGTGGTKSGWLYIKPYQAKSAATPTPVPVPAPAPPVAAAPKPAPAKPAPTAPTPGPAAATPVAANGDPFASE